MSITLSLFLAAVTGAEATVPEPDKEIVVTATKRARDVGMLDAPVSVATAEKLTDQGIVSTQDIQRAFPGLIVNMRGNRAYSNFTVRGISSPDYFNPSVQVYVDGVAQTASAFSQRLLDIDRVEFLRGPQGTLYGANALGGVLVITSRQRTANGGYVQATGGDLDRGGEAAGTLVLSPQALFLDMAGSAMWTRGRIDDAGTGDRNIDSSREFVGRATLRYAPAGSRLSASLTGLRGRLVSHEELYLLPDDVDALVYRSDVYGPRPYLRRDMTSVAGKVELRTGPVTLSSVTTFQRTELVRDFPGGRPGPLLSWPQDEKLWTQELRAATNRAGPIEGVAGLWFQRNDFTGDKSGFAGFFGASTNTVVATSLAAFAEATVRLGSRVSVTLGGRYSHDRSRIRASRPDTFGNGMGFSFGGTKRFDAVQPKASIAYALAPDVRAYATVSRGYKPGGYNRSISSPIDGVGYRPESGTNWEAGLRAARLANDTLSLSLAAYRIDSRDQQIYVGQLGQQTIRNAARARSQGIEAEAAWRPDTGTSITANVAAGRSRFRRFVDPFTAMSYSGNTLPYAPDVIARGTAERRVTRMYAPVSVSLWGGVAYAGRVFFDEANTATQPAVATVDLGVNAGFGDGFTMRLLVRNVGDRIVRTSGYVVGPTQFSTVDVGRRISLTLRRDF